ncbi:MAG: DMT family transporter [Rhodospirillaceae bacterium]|nr:DMT family transporter [Rhodospirillaceae bacterium]
MTAPAAPGGSAVSRPLKAAVLMILAVFCFSILNAAVKGLENEYSIVQIIVFARVLMPLLAIWMALRLGGLDILRTKRPVAHIVRGTVALISTSTFVYALGHMTVSKAITLNFAAPLFVAVLAIFFLGEKVGPRRWAAIIVGFIGVIVIVRPDDGQIDTAALVAVASAVFYGATVITTRRLALTEHSATMLFYFGVIVSFVPALALPWFWVTPTGDAIWLFALVAIMGTLAWYLMAEAYRFGEATLIIPLDYTHLLWAMAFDWLIWTTIPAWSTFAGGALIVGANLFILWREARLGRDKAAPERP